MTKARAQQLRRLGLAAELARRHGGAAWTPDHDCPEAAAFVMGRGMGSYYAARYPCRFRKELAWAAGAAQSAATRAAAAAQRAATLARAEAALAAAGLDAALASGPRFRWYLDAAPIAGGAACQVLAGLVDSERRRVDIEAVVERAGLPARYAADPAFDFYRGGPAPFWEHTLGAGSWLTNFAMSSCAAAAAAAAGPLAQRQALEATAVAVAEREAARVARRAEVRAAAAAAGLANLCWASRPDPSAPHCGLCLFLDAYVNGGGDPGALELMLGREADRQRQHEARQAEVEAALAAERLSRAAAGSAPGGAPTAAERHWRQCGARRAQVEAAVAAEGLSYNRLYFFAQRELDAFILGECGFEPVATALRRLREAPQPQF
jgi:hypothetical protein